MAALARIGVVNYATHAADAEIARWAAATQIQMTRDVAIPWKLTAPTLVPVPQTARPGGIDAWIVVVDNAKQPAGLGWHDVGPDGEPVSYVLVDYTRSYSQQPSRVLSHETIEMCVDPLMTRTAIVDGTIWSVEPGDPLALDSLGYEIDGVLVSGCALPAYYGLAPGSRYDVGGHLPGPIPAMIHGSMLTHRDGSAWQSKMLAPTPDLARYMEGHPLSRRARRAAGRDLWRPSLLRV